MYSFVKYDANKIKSIQTLVKKCFNHNFSYQYITNKYNTKCFGHNTIGFFAQNNKGEEAAFYGVFPLRFLYENEDIPIAQSGDTMTLPDHRKKGLFVSLAKATYQEAENQGIQLIYGFPNENSYPGFKNKLDWVFTGTLHRFRIHYMCLPFCELAKRFPKFKPLYHKFVKRKLSKYEISLDEINLPSFNYSKVKGTVKKDRDFFEYKLRDNTKFMIQLGNFSLLIKIGENIQIGDVGYFEEDKMKVFLTHLKKLARKVASRKIVFNVSENHWLYQRLNQHIKRRKTSLPIGFYVINKKINVKEIQFSLADMDVF